jgi:hypothetical protein
MPMREWNKPATTLLLAFTLFTFCLYAYFSHLSFYYTLDGLAYSAQVEKDHLPIYLYFHPHHLLYTFLGRLIFLLGRDLGATWDGLVALQFFDLVTGALGAVIAFHLLVRETNNRFISALTAAGMAFSHSYWYFSTIPGVRMLATVTPLLVWYLLTFVKNRPPLFGWVLGGAHTLAVLGHQTNLLLYPAFLGAILLVKEKTWWEKLRSCFYYTVGLTAGVLAAYGFVGRYVNYRKTFHDWLWWVCAYFHSPQNWGGHFNQNGIWHGQSAMKSAFLPLRTQPLQPLTDTDPLTFGAAETILQTTVVVLLVLLLLRLKHHLKNHRQALWISLLWLLAFVPFFIWWEPWNIEFWVSSTVPCFILMGLVASDISQLVKHPILRFANKGTILAVWAALFSIFFFYNLQGSQAKTTGNHYDFNGLMAALNWKVQLDDLLVLDGINNVHYYIDRFQKRPYLNLYYFLLKYKFHDLEPREVNKFNGKPYRDCVEAWTALDTQFQETWKRHRQVWALTETVSNFDGGRELMEESLRMHIGRVRQFFKQYDLKPVSYQGRVYFYEVLQPALSLPATVATPEGKP